MRRDIRLLTALLDRCRAAGIWWVAHREHRRSLCSWCGDYLWLSDQPATETAYHRRHVHPACKARADEDAVDAALW